MEYTPLSFTPSANIAELRESATIAVSQRAKALKAQGREVIDLGAGEPDFGTPGPVIEAAKRALDEGATRYTAVEGILSLRQAIAAAGNARYTGPDPIAASDVVVSCGSKQSLYNACVTLFGPGDEVLVPTPSWTSYYEMVGLARATAVEVHGDPARGYKVDVERLERHATPRTRGLMLNSPSNPTGAVYARDELRAILELASSRGWWVISDEIYQHISYDGPAPGALDVAARRDNLIVVNGVAKAWAMTGWRVGWTISPAAVAKAMTALQSHTTSNTATVAQYAALAALTLGEPVDATVRAMVAEFRKRRDAALPILKASRALTVLAPEGAFYFYVKVPGAGAVPDAGAAFCQRLLEEAGVAIVPGSAFRTPDWVRISYAADEAQVVEACRRIAATADAMA
ncbi:MAG: pyridoxal phosphate-dependent aminotransferase [Gemmatimonadaceae bacterium]|nr:pyridoxal phosphate-dependent aminotransferase [Gemmatimonadaceae bacterium]MCW5825944.1 pyridoxal phosphate-dependent aminotransferase [Gemmatimonadaceae bacterium]